VGGSFGYLKQGLNETHYFGGMAKIKKITADFSQSGGGVLTREKMSRIVQVPEHETGVHMKY
jgi:hypothetical protein